MNTVSLQGIISLFKWIVSLLGKFHCSNELLSHVDIIFQYYAMQHLSWWGRSWPNSCPLSLTGAQVPCECMIYVVIYSTILICCTCTFTPISFLFILIERLILCVRVRMCYAVVQRYTWYLFIYSNHVYNFSYMYIWNLVAVKNLVGFFLLCFFTTVYMYTCMYILYAFQIQTVCRWLFTCYHTIELITLTDVLSISQCVRQ